MLRDDDALPRQTVMGLLDEDEVTNSQEDRKYANDDLGDVFGSAPPSPTFEHDAYTANDMSLRSGNLELSDIPRLKEKHETEGYRDGVTKGKAESVQKGFDEGYSLGAVLGLKIGKILGLLEGVCTALNAGGKEYKEDADRVEGLFADAKTELTTQSVFGKEWWGEDGVWKFEVPGEEEGKEVMFPDVAGAHPLVMKWERVVGEEVRKWGLDLGIMEGDLDDLHTNEEEPRKQGPVRKNHSAEISEATGSAKIMGVAKKDLNW